MLRPCASKGGLVQRSSERMLVSTSGPCQSARRPLVRVSHFSWAQSDRKRGRAYPARYFRGCAHAAVSRKSVMNIVNDSLCAENSARASGHSGPFQGQPLQGQVWIPRFSKVRNLNLDSAMEGDRTVMINTLTRIGGALLRAFPGLERPVFALLRTSDMPRIRSLRFRLFKLDFNSTNTSPCRDMTYVVFPDRRKSLATKNLRRLVPRIWRNSLLGNRLG